jgi:hypothetical protein
VLIQLPSCPPSFSAQSEGHPWRLCASLKGARQASLRLLGSLLIALFATVATAHSSYAQSEGQQAAERLQAGVSQKNKYRKAEAVADMKAVVENMKKLFEPILITGSGGEKDKWYSPHLRDAQIDPKNKSDERNLRKKVTPWNVFMCYWPFFIPPEDFTACPAGVCGQPGVWHGEPGGPHRPMSACGLPTWIYGTFKQDSNFKACCVRQAEQTFTSEQIASLHPLGDGWAGLFEFYYPVSALGWENDRTTTMIADSKKVNQCVEESDSLMENRQSQKWVADAITRNERAAAGSPSGDVQAPALLRQEVAKLIKDVRPKDKELRFTDSLQSEGLTVRPHLAALDPEYRKQLAKHFCMHPEQFDKIMDESAGDNVQQGGGLSLESLDALPMWANYCPKGVELMTNPQNSELENIDKTPTDFMQGMKAWKNDPLYCQRMHQTNPNMSILKYDEVLKKSNKSPLSQEAVGHTCLDDDNLNGGMVPVTFNRHAAVQRRTAIADHALGFLIAGGLSKNMRNGQKSYLKRFEPQPYSRDKLPFPYQTFIGKRFAGNGTNELILTNPGFSQCTPLSGEGYQWQNKADRLYISNKTHQPFTQQMIDDRNTIDKYRQDWADSQKEKVANHGLDDKTQNHATAFRIMAMCPKGFVRWRPKVDEHEQVLPEILDRDCREEYFGGVP